MFSCCSGFDSKKVNEKFDINLNNTDKGVKVEINPKDKKKVKPFQEMLKNWQECCDGFCE